MRRGGVKTGFFAGFLALALAGPMRGEFEQFPAKWQQLGSEPGIQIALERDVYEPLDACGRFVISLEGGKDLKDPEVEWSVERDGEVVASDTGSLSEGMLVVDFELEGLGFGEFGVSANLLSGDGGTGAREASFEIRPDRGERPVRGGKVPLIVPAGVPATPSGYPLSFAVPMPNGALVDPAHARVVRADGTAVPSQNTVRGSWGYCSAAGIKWLGVDVLAEEAPAWWPEREEIPYYLEFGEDVTNTHPDQALEVEETQRGIEVNTGPLRFLVRREGFNLLDEVKLHGREVLNQEGGGGAYLVDHEGTLYRAANDRKAELVIEEKGPMRTVIRVEGWYIKEGTEGVRKHFRLPTDRLCKFVTRVEAYAGLPWVRVLHTWINTSDSYSVFFNDIGLSLLRPENTEAEFGVEGGEAIRVPVEPDGVYLLQHLPDEFAVSRGDGQEIATGEHSDGSVYALNAGGDLLAVSHRETWQRFPKEMEVLPGELRFHVWPAHGRDHPEIAPYSKTRYHQLWFAHQGRTLDLRFPWKTLFSVMRNTDNPDTGIYSPGGTAMGGVQSSAMGIAITSDFMIRFGEGGEIAKAQADTLAFQENSLGLAEPAWVAASGALGPIAPYDPERFPELEKAAEDAMFGIWNLQDVTGQYGMFLYRGWHHNKYEGDGYWNPYRLYSAGHHYEAYIPWLYYARSGDPRHGDMGLTTMRHLTDLGIQHYDNPRYEHVDAYTNQRKIPGAYGHTNGFVFWGGDHALLGHPTGYGGVILAYYLTGDLRFREIIIDEWQRSLLERRDHPDWSGKVRVRPGREINNAMGELLDLYQFTHDPRVLALIEPGMKSMENNFALWGLGVQNTVLFRRTPRFVARLIESAKANREGVELSRYNGMGHAASMKLRNGYSRAARYALIDAVNPDSDAAEACLMETDATEYTTLAESFTDPGRPSEEAYKIADHFLNLPRVLATIRDVVPDGRPQILPMDQGKAEKHGVRVVVKNDDGRDFTVRLRGELTVPSRFQVYDATGAIVHEGTLPPGTDVRAPVSVGDQPGPFTLFLYVDPAANRILTPVTDLEHEVYPVTDWFQYDSAATHSSYFYVGAGNMPDGSLGIAAGKSGIRVKTIRGKPLDSRFRALRDGDKVEELVSPVPKEGVWLLSGRGYFKTLNERPLVLADSPERFFLPSPQVLKIQALPSQ